MVELLDHPDGVVIAVRAQPGGRQNAIRGEHGGMLKVSVTQVAEKGKANKAIVAVLAASLGIKKSQIELHTGATSHDKQFLIRGIAREAVSDAIADALRAVERN